MTDLAPFEKEVAAYRLTRAERSAYEREFETARRTNDNFGWDAHEFTYKWHLLADRRDQQKADRATQNGSALPRDRDQRDHQRAKTPQAKFVTKANLTKKLDRAYVTIGKFIAKQLKPLQDRIAELEARPALKHAGTWKEGKQYRAGNLVTFQGGLWLCQRATKQRPAQSDHYLLVVKSGAAK